jgi:hypothetical protein
MIMGGDYPPIPALHGQNSPPVTTGLRRETKTPSDFLGRGLNES